VSHEFRSGATSAVGEHALQQLIQNEKLADIDQLTHGVAYELNTSLGVIVSNRLTTATTAPPLLARPVATLATTLTVGELILPTSIPHCRNGCSASAETGVHFHRNTHQNSDRNCPREVHLTPGSDDGVLLPDRSPTFPLAPRPMPASLSAGAWEGGLRDDAPARGHRRVQCGPGW
jgi:hypothetical protein